MSDQKNKTKAETDANEPNRFLSSDETQPIEGGRSSRRSDINADIAPGSESTSLDDESREPTRIRDSMSERLSEDESPIELPQVFAAGLAPETKEGIEKMLNKGREVLLETKNYVRDNPGEAAGLIACSGAILWALLGTRPGRKLVDYGTPLVSRYLAQTFNQTLALQPRTLQ